MICENTENSRDKINRILFIFVIVFSLLSLELGNKKTWTIYIVYVLSGYRHNPTYLNEQMPTPNGVNYLLQFLMTFEILPISENKNQKWTFILCPYVCCYVTICYFVLRVRPYITFANIRINLQTSKKMREKLPKCLELSKILRIFAPSKVTFGYPGKFPERASRIRHYPF